jgi:hypothetical protein
MTDLHDQLMILQSSSCSCTLSVSMHHSFCSNCVCSAHLSRKCFGAGPGDKVCYYYGPKQAVYEELGHAEVVQMELRGETAQTRRQMEAFADTYFGQFRKTPVGMMRLDPQDAGPAYRNVIGIPKGIDSPLFEVLKAS